MPVVGTSAGAGAGGRLAPARTLAQDLVPAQAPTCKAAIEPKPNIANSTLWAMLEGCGEQPAKLLAIAPDTSGKTPLNYLASPSHCYRQKGGSR